MQFITIISRDILYVSVISYTQTDPTENWIHLKTEHLVLVRNFPYIFN